MGKKDGTTKIKCIVSFKYDPSIGDICCYAPWGNVCIYYADHGYEDLIKLGKIDGNGEAIFGSYPSNVNVKFEVLR